MCWGSRLLSQLKSKVVKEHLPHSCPSPGQAGRARNKTEFSQLTDFLCSPLQDSQEFVTRSPLTQFAPSSSSTHTPATSATTMTGPGQVLNTQSVRALATSYRVTGHKQRKNFPSSHTKIARLRDPRAFVLCLYLPPKCDLYPIITAKPTCPIMNSSKQDICIASKNLLSNISYNLVVLTYLHKSFATLSSRR